MTTIRDVAKECGVSAMTVSAVVNNRHGKVSADTRARILRVVEEMGYQPNAIARGLTRRRMNTVGVILSYEGKVSLTSDRYFSPLLDGVFAANKSCHQRTLVITEDTWEDAQRNLLNYTDGHCDGLVFLLPLMPVGVYDGLLRRSIPFVLIGESLREPNLTTVDIDNVRAACDATRYLQARGHTRIGLLSGNDFLLSSTQREIGFRQALAGSGLFAPTPLPPPPFRERGSSSSGASSFSVRGDNRLDSPSPGTGEGEGGWGETKHQAHDSYSPLVLPGDYSVASGYERIRDLIALSEPRRLPTAFVCGDDSIALGAWRALRESGRRVPEDVSLIGINDDQSLYAADEPLTTVRQPLHSIGERAIEMLLAQIDAKVPPGQKVLIHGEIIERGSVSRPAASS